MSTTFNQFVISFLDVYSTLINSVIEIRFGIGLICAAILIAFLKQRKAASIYLASGLLGLIIGFSKKGVIDLILLSIDKDPLKHAQAAVLFDHNSTAIDFLLGLTMLILPIYVANKRKKSELNLIIILSSFGITFSFIWSIALFLAHKPDRSTLSSKKTPNTKAKKILNLIVIFSIVLIIISGLFYLMIIQAFSNERDDFLKGRRNNFSGFDVGPIIDFRK